jgi:PleD family two-component response regulator
MVRDRQSVGNCPTNGTVSLSTDRRPIRLSLMRSEMHAQRPRVLVVEDEAPIRMTLEVALRGEGYEVRPSRTAVAR